MLSLDQLIMDPSIYSKDGDLNEVWVPGVLRHRNPWGRDPSIYTPLDECKKGDTIEGRLDITERYEDLQKILISAGLPETEDRTRQPRTDHNADTTTICVFGTPSFAMSTLLEGARQCPGNMLLCLSSLWFCPRPPASTLPPPLYVRQAVTFDLGGRTFLDIFSPPRRVTYLSWMEGDEVLLGQEWDCPIGGSPKLSNFLSNTLEMRLLLDRMELPLAPALVLTSYWLDSWEPQIGEGRSTSLVELDGKEGWEERVRKSISEFLALLRKKNHQKVVVKACGPQKRHSFPTTFYSVCDPHSVYETVFGLISNLHDKEAILLEGFIHSLPPRRIHPPKPPAVIASCSVCPPELTIRLCAVVCRSRGDQPILSKVVCSVGRAEKPLCHRFALPQSLETTLELWGVRDKYQKENILAQLKKTAENVMKIVMEEEKKLTQKERGGYKAQTDLLGVDFLLTVVDYMVTPVILGITSNYCLESCGIHECLQGSLVAGGSNAIISASTPLLETMLQRSLIYVMEKKEVLVVGSGGISKAFIWEAAKIYGIKIHLVESDPKHFASSLVTSFIHYDYDDQSCDVEKHAQNLLTLIKGRGLCLSGCMAFWDECTILAAVLASYLGLPGPPASAVRLAKQKTKTQLSLLSMSSTSPPFPYAGAFAVPCFPLGLADEGIEKAESTISYPLVVKPESGAGAVGVRLIQDAEECRRVIRKIGTVSEPYTPPNGENCAVQIEEISQSGVYCKTGLEETCKGEASKSEIDRKGCNKTTQLNAYADNEQNQLCNNNVRPLLLLAEYITGTEHDVDLVMSPSGQILAAYVSDNGPTLLPGFTETAAALPSRLGTEQRCQLIQAAAFSCRSLGLYPGVFNVELKLTETGPRLLEINPRMGGFYLRDWIRHVYGTDLVLVALALFCGVDPALPATGVQERTVLVGVMCTGENHEDALHSTAKPQRLAELHHAGYIRFNQLDGSRERGPDQEPYGSVACEGSGQREAREKLLGICAVLGLDTEAYPIRYLTGEFQ
ncbi:carnosine synthase 1 [Pelobates cultripes]|uniref:Carnosine synthase 1 n=1 Tax=Pelobates cultripes TaxID=61616 RepID=A0AAD1WTA9_PELCU|nr:carnosine synthase 1 [Pelobates cultripes]